MSYHFSSNALRARCTLREIFHALHFSRSMRSLAAIFAVFTVFRPFFAIFRPFLSIFCDFRAFLSIFGVRVGAKIRHEGSGGDKNSTFGFVP